MAFVLYRLAWGMVWAFLHPEGCPAPPLQDKVSDFSVGDTGITRPGEFIFTFLAELNITMCASRQMWAYVHHNKC